MKPTQAVRALALLAIIAPFSAGAEVLSLDSCRSLAVGNNKAVKIADENIRGASFNREAARAAYLPGLDFSAAYLYNQREIKMLGADAHLPVMSFDPATASYKFDVLTGPNGVPVTDPATGSPIPTQVALLPKEAMEFDIHNTVVGAFTLTQPIFMGGTIRALNEISKYAESLARASRDNTVQEVILKVDEAYWTVVSLREKKKLAESFVRLVDTLRYNTDQMLAEGVATRSDQLTVQVKYNEACIALTKVENGLALSKMNLAQICGLPVDTDIEPASEGEPTAVDPTAYSLSGALASRPDLEAVRHGISILESREKLTMGSMLPKLAAVGTWGFSNPNMNDGFRKRFGTGFSVGATLTVPLWHWGGNYNRYRAAKSNTLASRLMLDDLEEKVDLQLSQAKFSLDEAVKTLKMTDNNLKAAAENLRNAELGYREGVLTTDDVIAAQTAWLLAHSENIDARIGLRLCDTYLSKVAGRLGD